MIKKLCLQVLTLWLILPVALNAQQPLDSVLPIRGFCIGAPSVKDVDRFVKFIDEELATRKVNTLILRVDYNYQYTSHPELADSGALSKSDVQKIVSVCQKDHIS